VTVRRLPPPVRRRPLRRHLSLSQSRCQSRRGHGHGTGRRRAGPRPGPDRATVTRTQPDTGSLSLCLGASAWGPGRRPGSVSKSRLSGSPRRPSPAPDRHWLRVRTGMTACSGYPGHGDPSSQAGRAALAAESRELGPAAARTDSDSERRLSGPPRFPHRDGRSHGGGESPMRRRREAAVPATASILSGP
jgi:hypothetical protein